MKMKLLTLAWLIAAAMLLTIAPAARAQTAAAPDAATAAVHHKTLWEQINEGGIIMIPIGLCSMLTLYLIVDGVIRTGPKSVLPPQHVVALKNTFRAGDYVGAYNYCKANPSPFTNVVRVAVSLIGDGKAAVEEGILSELAKEDSKIQTQLSYLSVIGVCTPMIGLLGTVTGMIKAFATLGASRHRRSLEPCGGHRRGARGHGLRPLHRHPGLRRLLLPAQSRGQGDARYRGHGSDALPQDAL